MPYADVGQNSNSDMVYVDVDSDNNTWNSSSANFDFAVEDGVNPNCTQILYTTAIGQVEPIMVEQRVRQ
jgi:hypothetical protein